MNQRPLAEVGEFGLIEQLRIRLQQRAGVEIGIGDDAAVLAPLSAPVVTSDALVEGVHFRRDWTTPRALGRKALAVNVSDIAAMGGTPVAAFINLTLCASDDAAWVFALYDGFEDAARAGGFTIAGGDMSRTNCANGTVVGVTLVGNAPRPVLRSGARAGDVLIVSGPLGESVAGLWLLQNPQSEVDPSTRETLMARHHEPAARIAAIQAALKIENAVHAAMDLSDGLAGDAAHLARASGVALEIDVTALPLSSALMKAAALAAPDAALQRARDWALYGGEDYELLLAVAPESSETVCAAMQSTGAASVVIGACVANSEGGVWLCEGAKKMRPARKAWTHF